MLHFVKSKNLPFSTEEVKKFCSNCQICCELKPKFFKPPTSGQLIKSLHPMGSLSIDFKGPLPSNIRNKYLLTIVDEFSRFPFAVPCPDISSATVIKCLEQVFSLCGFPTFIHSDRGSSFISRELKSYLSEKGIATSTSTPYHPIGNGQVERYNGLIWNNVHLALRNHNMNIQNWEVVLPDVLHSLRSLLTVSTNCTPHERFFNFPRKSSSGSSLPSWLSPGPVFLLRFVRSSKHENLVDKLELIHVNPSYAKIRYPDGRKSTVSLQDLAPCTSVQENISAPLDPSNNSSNLIENENAVVTQGDEQNLENGSEHTKDCIELPEQLDMSCDELHRSSRFRKAPDKLKDYVCE